VVYTTLFRSERVTRGPRSAARRTGRRRHVLPTSTPPWQDAARLSRPRPRSTTVPAENLTRAEAAARAALVRVASYDVELDLTTGPDTFASTTVVRFSATPGASTFVDLIAPTVREVVLNGRALDVGQVVAESRIALADLATENELRVVADCAYMTTGEGLHRFVDPVDGEVYLYSQFEVADSRRVFAVFEQPDLKARFRFTVTAPAHWTVVSNTPTPEPEPVRDGVARWSFAPTPPLPSYVTAVIAGPYHRETGELESSDGRTIPLAVLCRSEERRVGEGGRGRGWEN